MRASILATLSCIIVCNSDAAVADIISLDYDITNASYDFDGMTPGEGTGETLPHTIAVNVASTSTHVADFNLSSSAGQFLLEMDFQGVNNTLASSTIFDFSSVLLPGGDTLQSFVFSAVDSSGTATDPGVSFTAGTNSFSFSTNADTTSDGGSLLYAFNFTTSSSSAAVPEPSSFACLLLGGIGLYARRRRRS